MAFVHSFRNICIHTGDLRQAEQFYGNILGLTKVEGVWSNTRYQCGDIYFDLIPKVGDKTPEDRTILSHFDDYWLFEVDSEEVYESLKCTLVKEDIALYEFYCNVTEKNKILCKDPDGNTIAITVTIR